MHKTDIFKFIFMPLVLAGFIYWRRLNGFLIFLALFITLGVSDFIGGRIKHTVMRARPFETTIEAIQRSGAGGYSFPSNHALNIFCAAMFLSYFFPRWKIPFFTVATLVALSRVYNGVHYPSDIFFGALLGMMIAYIGARATHKFIKKLEERKNQNG